MSPTVGLSDIRAALLATRVNGTASATAAEAALAVATADAESVIAASDEAYAIFALSSQASPVARSTVAYFSKSVSYTHLRAHET